MKQFGFKAALVAALLMVPLVVFAAPPVGDELQAWMDQTDARLDSLEARVDALEATSTTTTLASTTTTTVATTTTEATTTTAAEVLWSADHEGTDTSEWNGPSTSTSSGASVDYGVSTIRSFSGSQAMFLTVNNAGAGTGIRMRLDKQLLDTRPAAENLPDGHYSAWFYIPAHVSIGSGDGSGSVDTWNILQWKQTYPRDGGYTRRMIASIKLRDLGDSYGFTVASRAHDDGTWGDPKDEWFIGDNHPVKAGEWFHLEAYRKFSDDPSVGRMVVYVNGVEVFDRHMLTEITGGSWDDFGRWRRQWTVNNYVTGNNHSPDSHTLWVDHARVTR